MRKVRSTPRSCSVSHWLQRSATSHQLHRRSASQTCFRLAPLGGHMESKDNLRRLETRRRCSQHRPHVACQPTRAMQQNLTAPHCKLPPDATPSHASEDSASALAQSVFKKRRLQEASSGLVFRTDFEDELGGTQSPAPARPSTSFPTLLRFTRLARPRPALPHFALRASLAHRPKKPSQTRPL